MCLINQIEWLNPLSFPLRRPLRGSGVALDVLRRRPYPRLGAVEDEARIVVHVAGEWP